ncbi:MAG: hypothetical protein LWX52_09365, partial [Deltaproteobacteria bacterium]|nr:hypothetical protein [Deltaproteobacteria bacterium]
GEGWIKHKPTYLDFKLRVERKNNKNFQKYRLQFMPLEFGIAEFGIAYRYLKKEDSKGDDGLGMAIRLKGKNWKIPARYYPDLKLIHSKPMVRCRSIYADCQIIYYHEKETGSLRPGVDWKLTPNISIGVEARFYDDSDKNYIGLRLKLMAEH